MVEAGAKEVSEEVMLDAIMFAHEEIKKLIAFQDQDHRGDRQGKGRGAPGDATGDDVKAGRARVRPATSASGCSTPSTGRSARAREAQVKQETLDALGRAVRRRAKAEIADALYYLNKEVMRKKILEQGIRPDGRERDGNAARFGAKWACCRACMALPCSPVVRRRR